MNKQFLQQSKASEPFGSPGGRKTLHPNDSHIHPLDEEIEESEALTDRPEDSHEDSYARMSLSCPPPMDKITLNIGGTIYQTYRSTLLSQKGTYFDGLLSGHFAQADEYFVDRDGPHFQPILNFLRTGNLVIPPTLSREMVELEAMYYNINIHGDEKKDSEPTIRLPKMILVDSCGQIFAPFHSVCFRNLVTETSPFCLVSDQFLSVFGLGYLRGHVPGVATSTRIEQFNSSLSLGDTTRLNPRMDMFVTKKVNSTPGPHLLFHQVLDELTDSHRAERYEIAKVIWNRETLERYVYINGGRRLHFANFPSFELFLRSD